MEYKIKYLPKCKQDPFNPPVTGSGKHPNPENWEGDAPIRRDRHYAYLKHRAQAKFRNEVHTLTLEQWEEIWPLDKWVQRGRTVDSLCVVQLIPGKGWTADNAVVVPRTQHLKRDRTTDPRRKKKQ
jgi:hypothetical protein